MEEMFPRLFLKELFLIKSLKYIYFLLIMLGFSLFAGAKSYQINGTAPGCEGKQLTVLFYEEYFTMKMTVDQTIFVQSDESFSFEIETNENALVIFRIESVNGQFYLGGETTYNIVFDISKANPPIRFTNTNWSSIQFVNLPETDINKRLEKLNGVHANYYKEYSSEIYQVLTSPNSVVRDQMNKKGVKADMIKLDDSQQIIPEEQDQANKLLQLFIKRLKASEFDPSGDDYESVSAKYMVGELESLLGRNSEDLFKNYLMDRSYLDNLEYVSFYKMYYRNVLEEVYQAELKEEFIGHLYNLHLDSIVISTDSILVSHNDDLEFALLCGIEAGFELPNVSSRDVTVLLELLSRQASPPYKEMAENYLYSLSKGKKGFIPENCMNWKNSEDNLYT